MNIHGHIVDLMVLFRQRDYYTCAMQGSYPNKYMAPVLFPDDPALNYHNLDGVLNGTQASATFANMAGMEPEKQEACRERLLKYCSLDTLAMVKARQKLTEAVGSNP